MEQIFRDPRAKKLIPVAIVAVMIPLTLLAFFLVRNTLSTASPEQEPTKIRITDITDTSAVVTWVTSGETKGEVSFSSSADMSGSEVVSDERGTDDRFTHYVRLTGLNPQSDYYFEIVSDNQTFRNSSDEVFSLSTAPTPDSPSTPYPIKGVVTNGQNQSAIVYLSIEKDGVLSAPVSTYTNESGAWAADLSGIRTEDLQSIMSPADGDKVNVLVQGPTSIGGAAVTTNLAETITDITMAQNYEPVNLFIPSAVASDDLDPEPTEPVAEEPSEPDPTEQEPGYILGSNITLQPLTSDEIVSTDYLGLLQDNGFSSLPTTGSETTDTGTEVPVDITTSNVSEDGFTVVWSTTAATTGTVSYGESTDALEQTAEDTRGAGDYYTHIVEVSGLTADTEYFYEVISGDETADEGGSAFSLQLPSSALTSEAQEVTGSVTYSSGTADFADTMVAVQVSDADNTGTTGDSSVLTTTTETNGSFTVNLQNLLASNYASAFEYTQNDEITFTAYGVSGASATDTMLISQASTGDTELALVAVTSTNLPALDSRVYEPQATGIGGGGFAEEDTIDTSDTDTQTDTTNETLPNTGEEDSFSHNLLIVGFLLYAVGVAAVIFLLAKRRQNQWEEIIVERVE